MERRRRKWFKRLLIATAICVVVIVIIHVITPSFRLRELRAACENADRIVVNVNPIPRRADRDPGSPASVSHEYEIVGGAKVAEFLSAVSFCPSVFCFAECRCYGESAIALYSGDTLIADLRVKHGDAIAWLGGPWLGDSTLASGSYDRIEAFLVANGCPPAAERSAEFLRLWKSAEAAELARRSTTTKPGDEDSSPESTSDSNGPSTGSPQP